MSPEDQIPICQFITVIIEKIFGMDNLTKSSFGWKELSNCRETEWVASWKTQKLERTQNPAREETNLEESSFSQNNIAKAADAGQESTAAKYGKNSI
jgi:hypothetical protein